MKVQPLSGYALIEPVEGATKTASGIYLPDDAAQKPQYGMVVAVGSPKTDEKGNTVKAEFKAKDKVIYKKWGGEDIKVEGQEFKLVKFEDVMAIVA